MIDYLRILIAAKKSEMDERGASAVEYGLLVAGIAALIVAVVFLFGGFISGIFEGTCSTIDGQSTAVSGGCDAP